MKIQWALMPPLTGLEVLGIEEPEYVYVCVPVFFLMPIPYDPNSDCMCPCVYLYLYQYSFLCLVFSKALGIEVAEDVYACVPVYSFGANSLCFQDNFSGGGADTIRNDLCVVSRCI